MVDDAPSDLDALVARVDPDRWLSSRFISDAKNRADVVALYAFDYELARAPRVASNPLIGEIRLTWWREVLDEVFAQGPIRKHPTAEALAQMVGRHGLERSGFETMIDARYRELDARPMALEEVLNWAQDTGGACAVLAARMLDPDADNARARAGGQAWAIGRLITSAGLAGSDADDALANALAQSNGLSAAAFPAIAHATLARAPRPGVLGAQARVIWAVLRGRV